MRDVDRGAVVEAGGLVVGVVVERRLEVLGDVDDDRGRQTRDDVAATEQWKRSYLKDVYNFFSSPSWIFHTTYQQCCSPTRLSYCSTLIPTERRRRLSIRPEERTHEYEWDEADGKEELGGVQHSPISLSSSMMRVVNPGLGIIIIIIHQSWGIYSRKRWHTADFLPFNGGNGIEEPFVNSNRKILSSLA